MPRDFDHLAQRNGSAVLKEPEEWQRPSPDVAPFELDEAYPLRANIGGYLTSPDSVRTEDGNPSIVLEHSTNPELTVWINSYLSEVGTTGASFFVLACHDHDRRFYFDIPEATVESVLRQAMENAYWTIGSLDDSLLERVLEEL